MKKMFRVYLTEDIISHIKKEAEEKNMSMSLLISMILSERLNTKISEAADDVEPDDTCTIRLKGKAAGRLKLRASKLGISPTAYIRDIVINQKMTIIQIDRSDEKDLGAAIREYENCLSEILKELKDASSPAQFNDYQKEIAANLDALAEMLTHYCKKISKRKDVKARKILEDLNGD